MLRARLVVSVVSAVALLVVTVPLAQAGGGPGGGLSGPTTCRSVDKVGQPNQQITVVDPLSNEDVHVGLPALLCDLPATATPVNGPPLGTVGSPNAVMCYQVGGSNGDKVPVTITDPLGTHDGAQVGHTRLLCFPAQVE